MLSTLSTVPPEALWTSAYCVAGTLACKGAYDLLFRPGRKPMQRIDENAHPFPSVRDVLGAIPAHCKVRSTVRSFLYAARDFFFVVLLVGAMLWFGADTGGKLFDDAMASHSIVSWAYIKWCGLWSIYALAQGTVCTGLWVVAHECGHGAFSSSKAICDAVGYVLHTAMLVPYYSWQFTHHKHHKYTNHLQLGESHVPLTLEGFNDSYASFFEFVGEDAFAVVQIFNHLVLGWPLYIILNFTGGKVDYRNQRYKDGAKTSHFLLTPNADSDLFPPDKRFEMFISTVGVLAVCVGLVYACTVVGIGAVCRWYVGPYMVVNAWLVLYTWLQHTHPEVPQYGPEEFTWLKGAASTIDRPYPWWIDFFHHGIGTSHVLHHICFSIPHYHAEEATQAIRKVLGPYYRYDDQSIGRALWQIGRDCLYVPADTGVNYWVTPAEIKKSLSSGALSSVSTADDDNSGSGSAAGSGSEDEAGDASKKKK